MMTRKPLVAGNWKMNLSAAAGVQLVQNFEETMRKNADKVETVVAPAFTGIHSIATIIEIDGMPLGLGAQNVFWEDEGAFTGEISATQLKAARVNYVIVGHSERRMYCGDDDDWVNKKTHAVIKNGLKPILCCGESLKTREKGATLYFIDEQIRKGLAGIKPHQAGDLVVAYEPIWAIGTGKTATPAMAQEVCAHIRKTVSGLLGDDVANGMRILYGGSVNGSNAALFFSEEDIDGALVGGAALKAEDFGKIIEAAA
jgi:triosephosphate isomerase